MRRVTLVVPSTCDETRRIYATFFNTLKIWKQSFPSFQSFSANNIIKWQQLIWFFTPIHAVIFMSDVRFTSYTNDFIFGLDFAVVTISSFIFVLSFHIATIFSFLLYLQMFLFITVFIYVFIYFFFFENSSNLNKLH